MKKDIGEASESDGDEEDLMPEESEETEEDNDQDFFEDLDQLQTEIGGKVSDKLTTLINRALHEDLNEE